MIKNLAQPSSATLARPRVFCVLAVALVLQRGIAIHRGHDSLLSYRKSYGSSVLLEGCSPVENTCKSLSRSARARLVGLRLRGAGPEEERASLIPSSSEVLKRRQHKPLDQKHMQVFDTVMRRRFFFGPSFEIYGGVSGLFDYGPTGCAVKKGIITAWREHFVVEDGMLEVECPAVTPAQVLAASGHVQRFADLMVRDELSGECFRADKLLEESCSSALARLGNPSMRAHELRQAESAPRLAATPPAATAAAVEALETAGSDLERRRSALEQLRDSAAGMSACNIDRALLLLNVTSPSTGGHLSPAFPFNLMFATAIGPRQVVRGCLDMSRLWCAWVCPVALEHG